MGAGGSAQLRSESNKCYLDFGREWDIFEIFFGAFLRHFRDFWGTFLRHFLKTLVGKLFWAYFSVFLKIISGLPECFAVHRQAYAT